MASQPFLAEIRMFAGNFAPRGWMFCNGQILSIAQDTALFSLLGVTYGGNGQTTFGLPDLQGRLPLHQGQGPGLSSYDLGQEAGFESQNVTVNNMPAHQHTVNATGTPQCHGAAGSTDTPAGNIFAGSATDENYSPAASANGVMAPITVAGNSAAAGGGEAFPIMQPYLAVSFIICVEGIFPSRN